MSEWQHEERWTAVRGYDGSYEVSDLGRVRRIYGKIIGQWPSDQGYLLVRLSGPRAMIRVHRLVAVAFVPNPEGLPFVNHIDSSRSNNAATNLEWCTQKENLHHAGLLGRMQKYYWVGKRSPNARMSEDDVREIRRMYKDTGVSYSAISGRFNISKRSVGRIVNLEYYPDVQ